MKRLQDFTASYGRLVSFAKQHGLQNVKMSSQAGSVNAAAVAQNMINLRKRLELFYKFALRQT